MHFTHQMLQIGLSPANERALNSLGEPLERLAEEGQLSVRFHHGFWHPMDTLRDRRLLEGLWASGKAPWKVW